MIAPSCADIFFNNSLKNGLLPIVLDAAIVDRLFTDMYATRGYQLTIDLESQIILTPNGEQISFEVDAFRKNCLLHGLDDIGITLQDTDAIREFEKTWQEKSPWLFDAG
jgi:3-isopropylmalate/(R)-2-methylmalate dehydratase small subunit